MANRECNGVFFQVDGRRFYRCFLDNVLIEDPPFVFRQSVDCPLCYRPIDASEEAYQAETRTMKQYKLASMGGWHDLGQVDAIPRAAVAAALAELRAKVPSVQLGLLAEFDATIAKLGIEVTK